MVKECQKNLTGIEKIFLSSNPKELTHRLALLLGSYKAGNNSTFNEISAITDALRGMGKMSVPKIKHIFKILRKKSLSK